MKYLIATIFTLAAFAGFSQDIKIVPGDLVEITKPVERDTLELEDVYDQDIADIANIDRYIAEMQHNIDEAQKRKAERLSRIGVIEQRATEIKQERKDAEVAEKVSEEEAKAAEEAAKEGGGN